MKIHKRIERSLLAKLLPIPIQARHVEYSVLSSLDDDVARPSPRLFTLALEAVRHAQRISLDGLRARVNPSQMVWPGESYQYLAGLVAEIKPTQIVEIGTGGGEGALAMLEAAPLAKLATFDIVGWKVYSGTVFTQKDFEDGRLVQYTDDLTEPAAFTKHRSLLEGAQIIFIDAAKDGVMEQQLLDAFETLQFRTPPLLVFDDIRLWNMLKIWRDIKRPKLDVTSFGHWSGTGLVDWV